MSKQSASRRADLVICIFIWSLGGLAGPMIYPILPDMAAALHEAPERMHLTVSLFFAGFALSHLLILPLASRLSLVHLIALSLAIFAIASLEGALSGTIETVALARFVQGLAYGVLPVAVRTWLCRDRKAAAASRDLSIVAGVVFLIPIGTPLVGAALAAPYGWQVVFWLQAVYALVVLFPVLLLGRRQSHASYDAAGWSQTVATLRQVVTDRPGRVASTQMVLLYSLVMLLPFDIARIVPALSDNAARDAAVLVAVSFAAIALGSFLTSSLRLAFTLVLSLTLSTTLGLVLAEWAFAPSFARFALGTALVSFGLGLTVWTAMSRAMTTTDDPSLSRSTILGFAQYAAAFAIITVDSLLIPPSALGHFASAALILTATVMLGFDRARCVRLASGSARPR